MRWSNYICDMKHFTNISQGQLFSGDYAMFDHSSIVVLYCKSNCVTYGSARICYSVTSLGHTKTDSTSTRICAAEMAVRYAALSACRKVHVCHCNSLGGATWRSVTITGRTDRQTDRQSATQYAAPPREEGRITIVNMWVTVVCHCAFFTDLHVKMNDG